MIGVPGSLPGQQRARLGSASCPGFLCKAADELSAGPHPGLNRLQCAAELIYTPISTRRPPGAGRFEHLRRPRSAASPRAVFTEVPLRWLAGIVRVAG